jgi:hypothetical protein
MYQISSKVFACACYCGAEFGSEILAQTMKEIQELRAKVEALEQRQEQLIISPAHDGATLFSACTHISSQHSRAFAGSR